MKYSSEKIRQDFIDFFVDKKHKIIRSSPVYPNDDPTLLFTNAGMNQFKDIFLNKKKAEYSRVVNSQKCIRVSGKHNDLEEVGLDMYHHTFFEMLGNWSFGDFYKKEIIQWSWELLTEVWKLDKNRLWVTVYKDDDEARELWIKHTDVDSSRVLKFGNKDNFWEMGATGPCGPCSEIHYFTGDDLSKQDSKGVNALDEYREIWNLVFIEFNRKENSDLEPLPSKHVDTGAGLERLVSVLNEEKDHYMTDLFKPIIDHISKISGHDYSYQGGMAHRVIADHIRMISLSLADGIMPSNEGRGYVVRRVLRRACRFGRVLGVNNEFLFELVGQVSEILSGTYPEIKKHQEHIMKVVKVEESSFGKTLDRGLLKIDDLITNLDNNKIIDGEDVFMLYDTYGFPVDLTQLIANEKGVEIDLSGYEKCMENQKNRGRESHKFQSDSNNVDWITLSEDNSSIFKGYDTVALDTIVTKYRSDDNIEIICRETPFYAEAGGQIGDTGTVKAQNLLLEVVDTYKIGDDVCHCCNLKEGDLSLLNKNNNVKLEINIKRRNKIKVNHTATHILHKVLKEVIGEHVKQAGSLVADDRLRFDITHYEKLTNEQINKIERKVNKVIIENIPLDTNIQDFELARKEGAEALFGEKYDDTVRVVSVGDFSKELCGGTHVNRTGDIGFFKIISESSLAAGIRRLEAVTGLAAFDFINENIQLLNEVKTKLKCADNEVLNKVNQFGDLEKKYNKIKNKIDSADIDKIVLDQKAISQCGDNNVFSKIIKEEINPKLIVDNFLKHNNKKSICLVGIESEKNLVLLCGTDDLSENMNFGNLIKEVAKKYNSGGGGPKHFGTAGFKDKDLFKKAYDELLGRIKEMS